MTQYIAVRLMFAGILVLSSSVAQGANFELKSTDASEHGWSQKADCEATVGPKCASAYFCSNDIWMAEAAFVRVKDRRYAGEQLVIVKNEQPICAVN